MPSPRCPTVLLFLFPSARVSLRGSLTNGRDGNRQQRGTLSPPPTTARPPLVTCLHDVCCGRAHGVATTTAASGPRQRSFHTSARLGANVDAHDIDRATNHYEVLNLTPSATAADIKKSFYALSKTHHPDHNRADADRASVRFVRISDAYKTLSQPDRRAAYDQTLGLDDHHRHRHHHGGPRPGTSYHSSGPAGGRPATGLSRRRTTFRGPPPSFYRSGGWGAHGAKRSAAADESTGGAASGGAGAGPRDHHHNDGAWAAGSAGTDYGGFSYGGGGGGGMGPGSDPFHHRDEEVPHFDRKGHERTGRRTEEHRQWSRRARMGAKDDGVVFEPESSTARMFFVIGGVLIMGIVAPYLITRVTQSHEPKKRDWNRHVKG